METERTKIRISFDVSPELNGRLDEIASSTHSTKSEVLRKAIALIDVAVAAKEHGQRLFLSEVPPTGTSREIVGL